MPDGLYLQGKSKLEMEIDNCKKINPNTRLFIERPKETLDEEIIEADYPYLY
jgi:hypothetical protein